MHYLTQHYKNRCIQLQEQVDALSYHLQRLQEASGMAATAADDTAQQTYNGEGLAAILSQFFDPATAGQAQSNLDSYLRAWRAQSAGSGGIPSRNIAAADQFNNRSTTAGRSVAAAARGIMAAADGAGSMGGGFGVAGSAGGGAPRGGYGRPSVGIPRENISSAPYSNSGFGVGGNAGGPAMTNIPGDYNGDGRVDGADLGIALGNYGQPGYNFNTTLQNWTGSNPPASAAAGRFSVTPSGRRRR